MWIIGKQHGTRIRRSREHPHWLTPFRTRERTYSKPKVRHSTIQGYPHHDPNGRGTVFMTSSCNFSSRDCWAQHCPWGSSQLQFPAKALPRPLTFCSTSLFSLNPQLRFWLLHSGLSKLFWSPWYSLWPWPQPCPEDSSLIYFPLDYDRLLLLVTFWKIFLLQMGYFMW